MALKRIRPSRRAVLLTLLVATLGGGAAAGLWFGLPVRHVEVKGNRVLSAARVTQLAGVRKDFGWLYYEEWFAGKLAHNPWIRHATITKVFPDRVVIEIEERSPAARLARDGRVVSIDWDGTVLPGAWAQGPVIRGWGPDRTRESVEAARILKRYNVRSVEYSPSGLTVQTARGTIWSGSLLSLQKYATGVTMYRAKRINIYPWGVSVQE